MKAGYKVEVGDRWYSHPDHESEFGSRLHVVQRLGWDDVEDRDAEVSRIEEHDTRRLLRDIADELHHHEKEVWNEYLGCSVDGPMAEPTARWPSGWDYRWVSVYVVTGDSEGYYLHVDLQDKNEKRSQVFLGKTLGASWDDCWASAGRIARALGA